MNPADLLKGYDLTQLTIAALGGHSALDVCHGAKQAGLRSVVIAQEGRDKTYSQHFKTREDRGCVDEVIMLKKFSDVLGDSVQQKLRNLNTIFVHSRYFWVYFDDFSKVENSFNVPIFGSRSLLKLEERDQPFNQYHLLDKAGIRKPRIFKSAKEIDRPVIVKVNEAARGYERAFFIADSEETYLSIADENVSAGRITKEALKAATIEEYIVGAAVNFNFFYSPLTGELELLGTDTRRQTNLDGLLRLPADRQLWLLKSENFALKMVETGHIAVTVKESLLEKAFDLGWKFVKATQSLGKDIDPSGRGIIGPFALQGAVVAEEGKEDIVIFDVSLRIPGSPGIAATPYSSYLYGTPMSMGERVGLEIAHAVKEGRVGEIVT